MKNLKAWLVFLRTCDAIDGILPIIVRPHPGDDKDIWQQKLAGLRKTKVIYEQSSAPWIMASCGVLHRGCSSAVEAYVMGIKAGYIVLDTFAPRNNLPFLLSEKLSSGSCVEKFGSKREVLSCNDVASEAHSKDVFRGVLYTPDSSASDLISGILLSSKVSEEGHWTRSFFYSWKKQAIRDFDAFKKG